MDARDIAAGRERWQAALRRGAARGTPTSPRCPECRVEPVYGPPEGADVPGLRADRLAGRVPVHPRALPDRLPRPHLDDPPVRRLRQRAADQRALQDDPRRRRWRPVRRVRHADADGPRLGRAAVARRGRPLRRRDRLGRRHGGAVRRHRPGRRHHEHDDQRSGGADLLHVPGGGRAPGRRSVQAGRHAADRHLQGVHRAEGVAVRAGAAPAADRRPDGVLRARTSRSTSRCRSPATTSGRPDRRPRRSSRTRSPTASATSNSASRAAWT